MTMCDKAALRRRLRALHGGPEARRTESESICRRILESWLYREARVIAGYVPLKWEADVTPVLLQALADGKTLALPLCDAPPRMTLRHVTSLQRLIPGAYGIPEPHRDAPVIPADAADLLLVPLEGVDGRGMRLGKGGGYYDCLLGQSKGVALGCALSWQRTGEIPAEAWDRPLTACAFTDGILYFDETKTDSK